jgi:8-oxo-dGTP diphosphatase
MQHERFNIRVYGILERDGLVLVSHERIAGRVYAKFPGGGLEFGEGPREAVIREFMEELSVTVSVSDHFYTTDFYLPSAFDPKDQILSMYFRVATEDDVELPFYNFPPSHEDVMREGQIFCWHPIAALTDELLALPADRVVGRMLNLSAHL